MFLSGVSAGNVTRTSVRLSWNSPGLTGTDSLGSSRVLSFTGSLLRDEYGVLPVWQQLFPLPQGTDSVVGVMIADPVWEALDLPGTDRIGFTDRIGTDLRIHTRIAETRGGKKLEIGILPLRKNTESGRIEKLAFFTVVIETAGSAGPSRPMKPATVADHSVLAAGTWYKFGVAASGIYRISMTT